MNRRKFMKQTTAVLAGFGSFAMVNINCRSRYDFDLVLLGGDIVDGTGTPAVKTDLGIKDQRIVALGEIDPKRARRAVDISGLTLAPGFIDVHAHSEDELLVNSKAESKIRQGVTTEILGQDGGSAAPLTAVMQEKMQESYMRRFGLSVSWHDFNGYFDLLQERGIALNVASMVGQGTLRQCVIGESARAATNSDIVKMQELAREALAQGALGISSGLEYTPGAFATTEEITELCKVLSGTSGLYATHMRNEDDRVLEAVAEAVDIAKGTGIGLHISHLKSMGQRNWDKLDQIFTMISPEAAGGVSVTMDRYPYVAYSTGLSSLIPLWAREGGSSQFLARLADEQLRTRIRAETLKKVEMIGSWNSVLISSVSREQNRNLQGKTVAEISKERKVDPFEFVRTLLMEEQDRVGMCGFAMSEENIARIFQHPACMIASDGSAKAAYGPLSESKPHPRSYGTFPRLLGKYVRKDKVLSLPEAIRKITTLPAQRFGLNDRGQIKTRAYADLVVFDPETVIDQATFSEPHQYPKGIDYVLVNGEVVIEKGEHSGALPGRVLRAKSKM